MSKTKLEFKRIHQTLIRGNAVGLMRAHSCRYRTENVRHIFQMTGYLSHIPFDQFGGVFYKTQGRSGLIVFTDLNVMHTDWYNTHKSLILQTWTNELPLEPLLDEYEISHFIGMPAADQKILIKAENIGLWPHVREAYASGIPIQRIAEMISVPTQRVRGVIKKYSKEELTTTEF